MDAGGSMLIIPQIFIKFVKNMAKCVGLAHTSVHIHIKLTCSLHDAFNICPDLYVMLYHNSRSLGYIKITLIVCPSVSPSLISSLQIYIKITHARYISLCQQFISYYLYLLLLELDISLRNDYSNLEFQNE